MGSVRPGYLCPICGRCGNGGYALDWVGIPTCDTCNTQPGGFFEGTTAQQKRRKQLRGICANGDSTLHTLMLLGPAAKLISQFLIPDRCLLDNTD